MSTKEMAKKIIDDLPDHKVEKKLFLLKGIQYDDEWEDMLFCKQLSDEYDADSDPEKHNFVSVEELAADLGVKL